MEANAIPTDLVTRARALGQDALELVIEAYQRAQDEERARAVEHAVAVCEAEGVQHADRFVGLSDDEITALEVRMGAMPYPVVAAFYEGAAEAVETCCALLRDLTESPAQVRH